MYVLLVRHERDYLDMPEVYGVFDREIDAEDAADQLRWVAEKGWTIKVTPVFRAWSVRGLSEQLNADPSRVS